MTKGKRRSWSSVAFCSVCGLPQRETSSGLVCANGHGGAASVDKPKVTRSLRQRARNLAFAAIRDLADQQDGVMLRVALSSIARKVLHGKPKEGQCCQWEDRVNGGCQNCGDPCL